ncbi:MAG: class I SAM-dependent methyltransferase [Chromatiales bacterium]|nr:class I SAM-dependent methyltransferase [Chromatiales bacterium]
MEADQRHIEHRQRWQAKPVLRAVYEDYFKRMLDACAVGSILEIGGGSGGLAQFDDRVLSSDLGWTPWLDFVADAAKLPIADSSIGNIAMLDVLHHIAAPADFFAEAARVLLPGGRLIMIEPAITLVSAPFYRWVHPEPVDMQADPLAPHKGTEPRDLYDGNQAVATTLFGRRLSHWQTRYPQLRLLRRQHLSVACYPLSGGYRPWSLIPARAAPFLLAAERAIEPWIGRWTGFRVLVVVERTIDA